MNKLYLILTLVIMMSLNLNGQSKRTLFFEEFTQASCPPCEATTPALNEILEANSEKLVQLRYQTSWPGVDPMNADNPEEVQERVDYYGVTGVPNLKIDGADAQGDGVVLLVRQDEIDNQYAVEAPILVTVKHVMSSNLTTALVNVTVTNEGTTDYVGGTLRVAFAEETISWDTPPGSTSIQVFDSVLKGFVTGAAGMDLPTIAAGESWSNTWDSAAIPLTVYDANEIGVVAFVQDDATRAVHNAAYSEPLEQTGEFPDLAFFEVNFGGDDVCDKAYTPSVGIANIGTVAATGYTANFYLDGELMESLEVTDELAPGSPVDITFAPIQLPDYSSVATYSVIATNGELVTNGNQSSDIGFGRVSEVATEGHSSDFESTPSGEIAENLLDINMPLRTIVLNGAELGTTPLGAYSGSQASLRVNYYQWNPANITPQGDIVIGDKIQVSSGYNMTFDYAFTTWDGSNDRMQVQVSSDCGANYTTVWDKMGSEMATAPELNANSVFVPTAAQWRSEEISLADYEGQEVIVRFLFTSGWGDMMYLDNINVAGPSDINELTNEESLEVHPNPANEQLLIDLTLNETSSVSYALINNLGQIAVRGQLGNAKVHREYVDVSTLQSGAYLLNVQIGDRQVVKRIHIIH